MNASDLEALGDYDGAEELRVAAARRDADERRAFFFDQAERKRRRPFRMKTTPAPIAAPRARVLALRLAPAAFRSLVLSGSASHVIAPARSAFAATCLAGARVNVREAGDKSRRAVVVPGCIVDRRDTLAPDTVPALAGLPGPVAALSILSDAQAQALGPAELATLFPRYVAPSA